MPNLQRRRRPLSRPLSGFNLLLTTTSHLPRNRRRLRRHPRASRLVHFAHTSLIYDSAPLSHLPSLLPAVPTGSHALRRLPSRRKRCPEAQRRKNHQEKEEEQGSESRPREEPLWWKSQWRMPSRVAVVSFAALVARWMYRWSTPCGGKGGLAWSRRSRRQDVM